MMARRSRTRRAARRVLIALALVLATGIAAHLAGLVLLAAATGAGGYWAGLHRRPIAKATTNRDTAQLRRQLDQRTAERDQLAGQLGQARADARQLLADCNAGMARLRAELADAKASATAAWDAAADRPPRRMLGDTAPLDVLDAEQLIATPMSGAHRIGRTP